MKLVDKICQDVIILGWRLSEKIICNLSDLASELVRQNFIKQISDIVGNLIHNELR